MRRYVEHKKAETAFRLWDLDSNGRVLREKFVRGLLRCAHVSPAILFTPFKASRATRKSVYYVLENGLPCHVLLTLA